MPSSGSSTVDHSSSGRIPVLSAQIGGGPVPQRGPAPEGQVGPRVRKLSGQADIAEVPVLGQGHVPDVHTTPRPWRHRVTALAGHSKRAVPQVTVLDQPPVEQIPTTSPQEGNEPPDDVGVLPQRLGGLVFVGQVPKPGAQRLHRTHRTLVEEHRHPGRDRSMTQQPGNFCQADSLITQMPLDQQRVHK
jgi:hypothetical protein